MPQLFFPTWEEIQTAGSMGLGHALNPSAGEQKSVLRFDVILNFTISNLGDGCWGQDDDGDMTPADHKWLGRSQAPELH